MHQRFNSPNDKRFCCKVEHRIVDTVDAMYQGLQQVSTCLVQRVSYSQRLVCPLSSHISMMMMMMMMMMICVLSEAILATSLPARDQFRPCRFFPVVAN